MTRLGPVRALLLVSVALAAGRAPAFAQTSTAGWQNGFAIQTTNGDFRLSLGGLAQTDGRFSLDDPAPFVDTFALRKARLIFQGRIAKYFDFRITPDFGSGTPTVVDAYMDVRVAPAFRIRTGKDKTPVGLEVLQSDTTLFFPERSLASSLLPNRDIGVQAQGDLAGMKLSYAAGVFNGVTDGSSSIIDVDTNNAKDLAGRVVYQPFHRPTTPARGVNNLGLHFGSSFGHQTGALPSFRTSAGQTYFSYAGASADGDRVRLTPGIFYYLKRGGVFAEYVRVSQEITKGAVHDTFTNTGWDVTGVINLTGEEASSGIVTPQRPFDPATGDWGAVQLVGRYAELDVDADVFAQGLAATTASERARQATVGINWYPVQYVKYYLTYERTTFGGGAANRPPENAVIFRVQLAF